MRHKIFKDIDSAISFVNNIDHKLKRPLSFNDLKFSFINKCKENLIFLFYKGGYKNGEANKLIPTVYENRPEIKRLTFEKCMEII